MTSYAARLNYGYKSRYLLTATLRRDGSSKFTKDNRWGTFPSAAAAWRISEEPFMQKVNWLSNLKLRLAYGVTGNNTGIGSYDTQQTLSSPISYPFGSAYSTGYTASKIVNQDLKWETSTEYHKIGTDRLLKKLGTEVIQYQYFRFGSSIYRIVPN